MLYTITINDSECEAWIVDAKNKQRVWRELASDNQMSIREAKKYFTVEKATVRVIR